MSPINNPLAADKRKIGLLLSAVILVTLPHVQNLAAIVIAYFAFLLCWRIAALYFDINLPKGLLLFGLTLAGPVIVLGHYHRIWGQEAGSSLFLVGLGLKLMELKTQRDAYLVVFLAFFVALTQYLFSQTITMAAYTLAVVVLMVASMIGLNSNKLFPIKARLRMACLMVAQAFPIMVILFVFFPRIAGPLWTLPQDVHTAKTGLSETITPGSFNQLALSNETAFRVDFEGKVPPPKSLYWRGPVFWVTDGNRWTLSAETPLSQRQQAKFLGGAYRYSIILEPHNRRWVFALDLPNTVPDGLRETAEFLLLSKDQITERRQFELSSATVYRTGPLNEQEYNKGLQLHGKPSARLESLVKGWREESQGPRQFVERALHFFREEKFYYSLNPPKTQGNPVESFLFDTRSGFCEHYATAFVVLMRQGGIPARVITGYQGGHWNDIGHFLEVKQADAHAWAEVWLPETGWTRIDPTAAVAPERIERGLDVAAQTDTGEIRFSEGAANNLENVWRPSNFWLELGLVRASLDHAWARWVLSYNPQSQSSLFQWVREMDWHNLLGWLIFILALLASVTAWIILPRRRNHHDPAQREYHLFMDKVESYGLVRGTGEGASDFAQRIRDILPELGESAERITRLYVRIRYERSHGEEDLKTLRRMVKAMPRKHGNRWRRLAEWHLFQA